MNGIQSAKGTPSEVDVVGNEDSVDGVFGDDDETESEEEGSESEFQESVLDGTVGSSLAPKVFDEMPKAFPATKLINLGTGQASPLITVIIEEHEDSKPVEMASKEPVGPGINKPKQGPTVVPFAQLQPQHSTEAKLKTHPAGDQISRSFKHYPKHKLSKGSKPQHPK
ncbi:hypothetical protein U1Q18_003352 [Sarracenia purpurea var. burkii]